MEQHARTQKISFVLFVVNNLFNRGPYGPPREVIGPRGSNYFSREIRTNPIAICNFPGGESGPRSRAPLDPRMEEY